MSEVSTTELQVITQQERFQRITGVVWAVVSRVGQMLLTLLVASFLTFSFLRLAPGDPVSMLLGTRANDPEAVALLNAKYHFDDPFFVQYWRWITGVVHGDFGTSLLFKVDVTELIASRVPTTLLLLAYGSVLMLILGLTLGLVAARSRKIVDVGVSGFLAVGLATPSYVIAIVLITIFSLYLNWFPVFGSGDGFFDRLYHLTLPALTLALSSSAAIARVTRASIIEEGNKDHVATAEARGFSKRDILWRHIFRNALLPITTIAGLVVASLIAGTVIVERAFGLDGLGSLLVLSITRKDYTVVQAIAVLIVAAFLVINALVDALYSRIDPRTQRKRIA